MDIFEICWNDNVKARILDETQSNAYRQNDKPRVHSQFDTYDYFLKKLMS
jgi:polyphosphate kinase